MVNVLKLSGVENKKCILLILCICILYAISDEIHQMFVPGRGAQGRDIVIDSVGSVVGIIFGKGRGTNKTKFIPSGNNRTKE